MRDSPAPRPAKPRLDAARFPAAPQIGQEALAWLQSLAAEKRASRHTLDGYGRDVAAFLAFLTDHLGQKPDAGALIALQPADLRAYLARRRNDGLESRSLLRALAAIRNFLRFLEGKKNNKKQKIKKKKMRDK
jgi:integrase/recombinase XerC